MNGVGPSLLGKHTDRHTDEYQTGRILKLSQFHMSKNRVGFLRVVNLQVWKRKIPDYLEILYHRFRFSS
jgi:hypothetical protein